VESAGQGKGLQAASSEHVFTKVPKFTDTWVSLGPRAALVYTCQSRDEEILSCCFSQCLPLTRNWDAGEKCVACIKGGQDCGPHERYHELMPADTPGSGVDPESPPAPIASSATDSSGLCQNAKDEAFNQQLLYRTGSLPKAANPPEASLSCDVFKTFTNQSRDNTPDAYPADVRTLGYEHVPTAIRDGSRSSGQAAVNSVEAPPSVDNLFAFLESVGDMNLDEFAGSENGQQCHFVNLQAEIHSKRYFGTCSFLVLAHLSVA
jgi:hypothetical protein